MAKATSRIRKDTSQKSKSLKQPRHTKKMDTMGTYKGIQFESLEELACLQWLFELQKAGYVQSIQRAESYLLCNSLTNDFVINLKTTSKPGSETLLHGHSYTPEFIIRWNKCALDKFVWVHSQGKKFDRLFIGCYEEEQLTTYIEVKPMWDQNNMERLFKLNQKWMWDKYKIFVNLVKPQALFEKTFTPLDYLTTPGGRPRKVKWEVKNMSLFLNSDFSLSKRRAKKK